MSTPLNLEVGATYRNRAGKSVRITGKRDNPCWPYADDAGFTYDNRGRYWDARTNDMRDLIALVSDAAKPAPQPKPPAAPLSLEVGATYRNREGSLVRITHKDDHPMWPFEGTDNRSYTPGGYFFRENHPLRSDLIKLVSPAEAEEPATQPAPSTPSTAAPLTAPLTAPLNPFASIQRTVLADGTHILDAIDTAGNAWHRTISTAADWPWQLTTPLPKLRD